MIRAFVVLSVLLALAGFGVPQVRAEADPSDRFLSAYFLIQEGDAAEGSGNWSVAHAKFSSALAIISEIKTREPDWHPALVEFRSHYCADHIAALIPKLPAGGSGAVSTITTKIPEPTVAQTEAEQVTQLKAQLRQSRDEARSLSEMRDQLTARIAELLRAPAPTDRETTQEVLRQLHAMQATNAHAAAQLVEVQARAAKASDLANQLTASQQKIKELETTRDQLNAKLQDALTKIDHSQSSPQVEELVKTNATLTAQLAAAHTEITQLRDQILAKPQADPAVAAEAVKLRSDLVSLRQELDQTKSLLAQRTQELTLTRAELDKARAENIKLATTQDELIAKLNESDRQLQAAKAAGEKNDQLIQQLHKENDLLHQIAERQTSKAVAQAKQDTDSGGFLWFKHKPKPAPPVSTNTVAETATQSEPSRLTASVKAPAPSDNARAAAESVRAEAAAIADSDNSSEVRLLLAQAKSAMDSKDFPAAKTYLTSAVTKDPRNINAYLNLGTVLYQMNQLDEAGDMLHKALEVEPNQGKCRALLGVIDLRKGRIDDAYNELTRAVAIDPRNSEAHNYLGIVMTEKGWVTAGEQEIRRAIELKPEYADAHFNIAVIYAREHTPRLELSRYHYQKAIELGAARDPQLEGILKSSTVAETPKPSSATPTLP